MRGLTAINARNARLPLAFQYPYLLPSQIPQSMAVPLEQGSIMSIGSRNTRSQRTA